MHRKIDCLRDNGFGSFFIKIEDVVVDVNHDRVIIGRFCLYFHQVAGKDS